MVAAQEFQVKKQVARRITTALKGLDLNQSQAAKLLGVDHAKVSTLVRGRLDEFSLDRLLKFANAVGLDVEIVMKPGKGKLKVIFKQQE